MKKTRDPITTQLRMELKQLKLCRRKVAADFAAAEKKFALAKKDRTVSRRNVIAALKRIDRRTAILNGRLAA